MNLSPLFNLVLKRSFNIQESQLLQLAFLFQLMAISLIV
ncbi:hypothetical protein L292_1762 [Acinetobacter junii CIP 107470 = MTCC 11364]|uniref:Uncharacterized protein n=1 Tax=Acinetobacter junii CIP 107470 = MTCC 11364 TaxID=1217666 RepID=S7WYL0_ACIJU|nr:hypothetical protein L292_1762 [Acinetobacter junii CIP 107470 = MTCC 11364]